MDSDDVITPHALFEFAQVLNDDPKVDLIYSDEDRISVDNVRYDPFFKPDWSPEFLESCNYIGHFASYRLDLARKLGGLRSEFDGAQDYDFLLRYTEHAKSVRHVREILYHWRALPGSTSASIERKAYVIPRARQALEARLQRQGDAGEVSAARVGGWFDIRRTVTGTERVSIIVSAGGGGEAAISLETAAKNVRGSSAYGNVEIILARNSHSAQLNAASASAQGAFLLFVDDDVKAVTSDWLEAMLRCALRPGVGVVGAKILFDDDTLRHVGLTFRNGLPRHIRLGFPGSDWGYRGSSGVTRNCLAVSRACMMVRKSAFDEMGGFDRATASEYIDADLCLRFWQSGLRTVLTPHALLVQDGRDRSHGREGLEGAERFRAKWGALAEMDPFYGANLSLNPPTFEFEPSGCSPNGEL